MKIEVLKPFKIAPDGNTVLTIEPGVQELDDKYAQYGIDNELAKEVKKKLTKKQQEAKEKAEAAELAAAEETETESAAEETETESAAEETETEDK